ncbi:Os07g0553100 [Oryza sativa Japonica Group]|uniref:Os07g0553100 protein n=2 Tax=Oryza sativa subsp. japonica TaxID=39947 RepID=Q6ZF88_ORYSJ|nr:hypothetical protein [Oryza sativa Japonica Group]BAT02068.1 Os07g0553100 [Oryza sativa Japonica Group]
MVLKEQEESSTAFVESPLYPADKAGSKPRHVLVASSGFSVNASGADSDNGEDRSSDSSQQVLHCHERPSPPRLLALFLALSGRR